MKMNPCIEDLSDMIPNKEGRYCNSCEKTIIDLTEKTPEEIQQLYYDSRGNLCGIIKPSQMYQSKYYHPLKRFALALLIVFGSSLFIFAENIRFDFDNFQAKAYEELNQSEVKHHIKGYVYSEGSPLPNAQVEVVINNKNYIAFTNVEGQFDLQLPEINTEQIEVTVTHNGFHSASKLIETNEGRSVMFAGKFNLDPKMENLIKGKVALKEDPKEIKKAGVISKPVEIIEKGEIVAPEPVIQGGIQKVDDELDFE